MNSKRNKNPLVNSSCFTLIELLVVMSIIAILMGLLQPVLMKAKERAKFARWQVYVNNLRSDPALLGQWVVSQPDAANERVDANPILLNNAQGTGIDGYSSKMCNGEVVGDGIVKLPHKGRWGKPSLFNSGKRESYKNVVKVADNGLLDPGQNDYTVSIWFKPLLSNRKRLSNSYLICKGLGRNPRYPGWAIMTNPRTKNNIRVFAMPVNSSKRIRLRATLKNPQEKWYLITMVINNTDMTVKLYIDDKEVASQVMKTITDPKTHQAILPDFKAVSSRSNANTHGYSDFCISNRYDGRRPFRGYIDDVEVFQRPLSQYQIKHMYDMGFADK